MKTRLLILWTLLPLLLIGCGKSKFEIEFALPQDYNTALRVVYFATSKKQAFRAETMVSIESGKAKVTAPGNKPMVVYLEPLSSSSEPILWFYAEKGDNILITGDSQDPLTWKVDGNDINKELTAWREKNLNVLKSRNKKTVNQAVYEFVKENPENPLSTLLLLCNFYRGADESLYARAWDMLKGEAKKLKYIDAAARADQIDELSTLPSDLQELEIYVKGDSMLKIYPKENNKTLIFFWERQVQNRKELIDTLKTIRKEKGDSLKVKLVDISFDIDTLVWSRQLASDSVSAEQKSWTRGWIPGGVMNSQLLPLQIPDAPFVLVVDKTGKQLYRGTSLNEAKKRL